MAGFSPTRPHGARERGKREDLGTRLLRLSTRGACNPYLQVAFTHARHVCSFLECVERNVIHRQPKLNLVFEHNMCEALCYKVVQQKDCMSSQTYVRCCVTTVGSKIIKVCMGSRLI